VLMAVTTTIKTEDDNSTLVARTYRGPTERDPRSQVARIPPEFVMMKPIAIAVARRVCGAALLALQVESVGAERYVPGMEKKREAY